MFSVQQQPNAKDKASSIFKSSTKRFIQKEEEDEVPGPGAYYKEGSLVKRKSVENLKSSKELFAHNKALEKI